MLVVLALIACGSTEVAAPAGPTAVTVQLNWYPEPEFGGIYQAKTRNLFDKSLNVDIQAGGAGTPVIAQVASGRSTFGVTTADELVLARGQGADVVAIFATYQTHPACILVHGTRGLTSLADLNGGTLALEDGIPFAQWLYKKFPFQGVTRIPYAGGVGPFVADPLYAQQGYVTSEVVLAKAAGAEDTQCFMVADTGYNPYANVVVTSREQLRDHPDDVAKFVAGIRKGWTEYLDDGTKANAVIHELNPLLDEGTLRAMWEIQKPLVLGTSDASHVGEMSVQRWETLISQLQEIGALTGTPPEANSMFTNEFLLPKAQE